MRLTKEEYEGKPKEYRGVIDGKPALLYADETGATVWGPVEIIGNVRSLTCCCCGENTTGRQWYNRDTGYGLCGKCAKWIATRESSETMHDNYGEPGVHYFVEEVA